jgi:thymidylate synthase ThyX
MISAKIVQDSINSFNIRLTSWELEYPLSIHAELMTHRVFSRNAASSRAIPYPTFRDAVEFNPALPIRWGTHQKGMQSGIDLSELQRLHAILVSKNAMAECIEAANYLHDYLECHKSIVNRLLAPWAHIKVLVTGTDFHNFFALRAHPDAEPNFQVLAYKMLQAYLGNVPNKLNWKEWHLPYACPMMAQLPIEEKIKVSVARACWVSYNKPDKTIVNIQDAIDRHDAAEASGHWSPFEHVAQARETYSTDNRSNFDDVRFAGWFQYRKFFANECKSADLYQILADCPDWIKPHLEHE